MGAPPFSRQQEAVQPGMLRHFGQPFGDFFNQLFGFGMRFMTFFACMTYERASRTERRLRPP